jgi:hypothetical protein
MSSSGTHPGRRILVLLVLSLTWLLTTPSPARGTGPEPPEEELLTRVNQEREERGLKPLLWNPRLAQLARLHAMDMRSQDRLSHKRGEDGASYMDRLVPSGLRPRLAAENIAMGPDIPGIHLGLMRSPGHRAAILNPGLEEVGIGVVFDEAERLFWVAQDFASLMPSLDDAAALAAVQQALDDAWRNSGAPTLQEKTDLSRSLIEPLDEMVRRDKVTTRILTVPSPAWVFAYTTDDPGLLPEDIRSKAGQARSFAAAAGFRRTGKTPLGIFWVVLALTDPVGNP